MVLVQKMDPDFRWSTCAGVVDLVLSGDISARKGVSLLVVYRQMGGLEQRKHAVVALRLLAHNADVGVARSSRLALHDMFVEDMWRLFTSNHDAIARVRSEYDEVVTGSFYKVSAAGSPAAPTSSVPAEMALVQEDDGGADSLESF